MKCSAFVLLMLTLIGCSNEPQANRSDVTIKKKTNSENIGNSPTNTEDAKIADASNTEGEEEIADIDFEAENAAIFDLTLEFTVDVKAACGCVIAANGEEYTGPNAVGFFNAIKGALTTSKSELIKECSISDDFAEKVCTYVKSVSVNTSPTSNDIVESSPGEIELQLGLSDDSQIQLNTLQTFLLDLRNRFHIWPESNLPESIEAKRSEAALAFNETFKKSSGCVDDVEILWDTRTDWTVLSSEETNRSPSAYYARYLKTVSNDLVISCQIQNSTETQRIDFCAYLKKFEFSSTGDVVPIADQLIENKSGTIAVRLDYSNLSQIELPSISWIDDHL